MPLCTDATKVRAPSKWLLMLEGRAFLEYASLRLRGLDLSRLPRGDGHPVLVIPGFGSVDDATAPLRGALRRMGYATYGWEQGRNFGMRPALKQALASRLEQLHQKHGSKVSVIGWSLGGVFAREMARAQPQHVRRVITL